MLETKELGKNIYYSSFVDEKFKFNAVVVNFVTKLDTKNAATNALICYLMRQSCEKYESNLKLGNKLRSLYGADLFCDVKKAGNMQIVVFGITVLDDEFSLKGEELTKKALNLLENIIFHTRFERNEFSEKEVEVEKANIADVIKSIYKDKKEFALYEAKRALFEGKDFGVCEYGDISDLNKIDFDLLKKAYKQLVFNSKIYVFYGGRKKYEDSVNLFLDCFLSKSERNVENILKEKYYLEQLKQKEQIDDVMQAKLVIGFATKEKDSVTNVFEEAVIFVMNAIFGGTATSLLFNNVREKLSLCYYCKSIYDGFTGVIWVESGVESKNIKKAKSAILKEFEVLKNGDFTEKELEQTVLILESAYKKVYDSVGKIASYCLFNFLKQVDMSPQEKICLIKKVTKDDIIKAAKKFSVAIEYVLKEKE